jgi:hypothetical protein
MGADGKMDVQLDVSNGGRVSRLRSSRGQQGVVVVRRQRKLGSPRRACCRRRRWRRLHASMG